MKYVFSCAVSILSLIFSAYPQHIVKGKRVDVSARPAIVNTHAGELTSLSGLPNGPVFVGGYAVKEGNDYSMKGIPLLWKIGKSSITLRELKSPYRIDECLWLDERAGWCYALGKGIYKTNDGGLNWIKEPYFGSRQFFFLDKTHGWYFDSDDSTCLVGIEREKMVKLARFNNFPHVKKLQFVSLDIGWLLDVVVTNPNPIRSKARFQKSEDGGKSWKLVVAPFSDVDSFQFLNETDGFVSTSEGLYATVNGGVSWDLVLDVGEGEWVDKIYFLSPNVGWTYGSRICMTLNGGHEWTCEKRPDELDGNTIKGFIFTNENNGWLLIDNRLYFTIDGGKSWKRKMLSYRRIQF